LIQALMQIRCMGKRKISIMATKQNLFVNISFANKNYTISPGSVKCRPSKAHQGTKALEMSLQLANKSGKRGLNNERDKTNQIMPVIQAEVPIDPRDSANEFEDSSSSESESDLESDSDLETKKLEFDQAKAVAGLIQNIYGCETLISTAIPKPVVHREADIID
jgi:hypothetical protein